jgi:hypothetical protein
MWSFDVEADELTVCIRFFSEKTVTRKKQAKSTALACFAMSNHVVWQNGVAPLARIIRMFAFIRQERTTEVAYDLARWCAVASLTDLTIGLNSGVPDRGAFARRTAT